MDSHDQGRTLTHSSAGQESHGVHLCQKCGWPFPNPHPSAKHRRAHKKICGSIEGYKLVDSVDSTHSPDSLSDEDHKTPIAQVHQVNESRNLEKSIGGSGAMSTRSEDEVFADAPMDFQDSGFGPGRQDSLDNASKADNIVEKDLTATISFKDCEDIDALEPPRNSADGSLKENANMVNIPILSSGQDLGLSNSDDSDDRKGSTSDVVIREPETLTGASEEGRKVSVVGSVTEPSIEQENDANENEKGKSNINLAGGVVPPSEDSGEASESVPVSEKRQEVTSDTNVTDDIVQSKEESIGSLASKLSLSDIGEQETDGKGNDGSNLERNVVDVAASNTEYSSVTSEKREDITSENGLADKMVEFEENTDKMNVHTVIDDSHKVEQTKEMDASTDTFQAKSDALEGTDSATSVTPNEVYDEKEKENESVHVLSVPDDIPVVDNAEIKLEDFKDHKRVKSPQLQGLAFEETIIDREDGVVRGHVSLEKSDALQSNELDDDIKEATSHMDAAEDSYKLGGDNEVIVREVLSEVKPAVLPGNKGSPVVDDTTESEKDQKVCSVEEKQAAYITDDSSGSMINMLPDVSPVVVPPDDETGKLHTVVGGDDMGIPESAKTELSDISGRDDNRRIDEASNLLGADSSGDTEARKPEKYDIDAVKSVEGLEEGFVLSKTNSHSESISTHHPTPVITEEVNECVRTLPESEDPHLSRVSSNQDDVKEGDMNKDARAQGECAGEDLKASGLDHSGGNEFERTSEDQLNKESMRLPSDAEPTSKNSVAVDNIHAIEPGVDASGISTKELQGEADNGPVKHQLDTTVADVSVESSSRADSLDGHWGSVSVLSTQSDYPAVIDSETLPSTGSHASAQAEKADIKKSKVKSDEFDPPSFLTLVEPQGSEQKAAASEIQTIQNAQQSTAAPLQAGWFPSLTHVANESEGRKKNEEIIAKVTNWNAKQHTPLKNLLGEANSETKPKSPNSKENPAVVTPREQKVTGDNPASGMKVSSILGPETPVAEPTNMEAGKEWNSPARYPADIKREKRKVKGRPLWVQFVCCSSVN